ncbi:MAG: hypothetical protein V4558_02230 [Gemmatimonadota bacterium]
MIPATRGSARPTVPWARPLAVEVDTNREVVAARYPIFDELPEPATDTVLRDFLAITRDSSFERNCRGVQQFVENHGLLISPFGEPLPMRPSGTDNVYRESLKDYVVASLLVRSTLRLHLALVGKLKPDPADVQLVADFLFNHTDAHLIARFKRVCSPVDVTSIWQRHDQPLPIEHRGSSGDLRAAWRALQVQRVLEVFEIWTREGEVRPRLMRGESGLVEVHYTGAAWGALAGAMQDAIVGSPRLGVCAYCETVYQGAVKQPRREYKKRRVRLCCGELECLRKKRREQTAKSRKRRV